MNSFIPFLLVAFGGSLGAICRFAITAFFQGKDNIGGVIFGTFLVNMLGCFVIGLAGTAVMEKYFEQGEIFRYIVVVGFLGSLTTFSTFAYENHALMTSGAFFWPAVYTGTSVGLGLLLVRGGANLYYFLT